VDAFSNEESFMSQVAVVSINTAKPGQEAKLEAALRALVEPSRRDAGCITYDLHRDIKDPGTFVFFELWESLELLQAHGQAAHVAAFRSQAPELIENSILRFLDKFPD
jgi:quinol monooxygenase YgiN